MLKQIKLIHTIIWAVMAAACIYTLYAGITGDIDEIAWLCIGLILFEGIVLLINKGSCPLTPMAAKYTKDRTDNFDIYLPAWLAKYNKQIFGIIFTLGLLLVIIQLIF